MRTAGTEEIGTDEMSDLMEIDPQAGDETEATPAAGLPVKKDEPTEEQKLLKEMRRTLKEQRTSLAQVNETAQFWMRKAQGQAEAAPKVEEAPKISVDLVEAIANNDAVAVKKALKEMGVAFQGDVDSKVGASRNAQTADQVLLDEYPDLADNKSEFFNVTAEIYNDLARDPALAKSPRLTRIAAELAEKRLGIEPEPETRSRSARGDDDEDEEDREAARVERVGRQAGGKARRPAQVDPRSEELDRTQKSIVAKLIAAGGDITEEGYRKRAQRGVRMSGLPARRAR